MYKAEIIALKRRPQNFRPISLLPIVSELLEQHIHQYITISPSETNSLSNRQWGFQVGRLTATALLTATNRWFKVLECRQDVCSVFFDLENQNV